MLSVNKGIILGVTILNILLFHWYFVKYFYFCILHYIWYLTSGIKAPSSTETVGIFSQGRDVYYQSLKNKSICRSMDKIAVGKTTHRK
jgi:hypothetical protein